MEQIQKVRKIFEKHREGGNLIILIYNLRKKNFQENPDNYSIYTVDVT